MRQIIVAAIGGLLSAVLVDLNAWKSWPEDKPFDFKKAILRWITGLIAGATAGLGAGAIE